MSEFKKFQEGAAEANASIAVGIAWYTRSSFQKCLAFYDDASSYPPTYDTWFVKTEEVEQEMLQRGMQVHRIFIEPTAFRKWCRANGYRRIDGKARTTYCAEMVRDLSLRGD